MIVMPVVSEMFGASSAEPFGISIHVALAIIRVLRNRVCDSRVSGCTRIPCVLNVYVIAMFHHFTCIPFYM